MEHHMVQTAIHGLLTASSGAKYQRHLPHLKYVEAA